MTKLTIHFMGSPIPELWRTNFVREGSNQDIRDCARGKTGLSYGLHGSFQWSRAVRAISLLMVRACIRGLNASTLHGTPDLLGDSQSLAGSLCQSIYKRSSWLDAMFGSDSAGNLFVRHLLHLSNSSCKMPVPIAVRVNEHSLPPSQIIIYWNGSIVSTCEELTRLGMLLESEPTAYSKENREKDNSTVATSQAIAVGQ